jgi:hypothetical protein
VHNTSSPKASSHLSVAVCVALLTKTVTLIDGAREQFVSSSAWLPLFGFCSCRFDRNQFNPIELRRQKCKWRAYVRRFSWRKKQHLGAETAERRRYFAIAVQDTSTANLKHKTSHSLITQRVTVASASRRLIRNAFGIAAVRVGG